MKYLSIDIETTGLDPLTCDVLEIGAYVEDTQVVATSSGCACFHVYIWKDVYRGDPYALVMNSKLIEKILISKQIGNISLVSPERAVTQFSEFLRTNFGDAKPVAAGKNVAGFDIPFLSTLPNWKEKIKFHHRVIDPGMMYFDPRNDNVPPDLSLCKKRAGLPEIVSHEALDDAWDVIQLVRAKFPLI